MKTVRLGIIGLGNMGATHANSILAGNVTGLELAAVADVSSSRLKQFEQVAGFTSSDALIESGQVDAVLIATPHFSHTTIGIAALRAGLHVLVEKPISPHKADGERLIAAHTDPDQVFAAVFNQRTDARFRRIRSLLQSGELGEIRRIQWTITTWFRSEAYYQSSAWRATWKGEGGGVLINQCPHHLDLMQWMFGMPVRVRAFCQFGRYHDIEVEDEVTAFLEYANGATGLLVTSTGEAPGTNRLEVAAENGRLVFEGDRIELLRNEEGTQAFSRTTDELFGAPAHTSEEIAVEDVRSDQHDEILRNFTAAILEGAPLIAPAAEGLRSVELANAMLLSTWMNETIDLPMSATAYESLLQEQMRKGRPLLEEDEASAAAPVNLKKSFSS